MSNSQFSSLIYRIIGKPERWHDDYIDDMHEIIDSTASFDEPYNFSELEAGDTIISRLKNNNETLEAFNTLLDESRFKKIILDDKFKLLYHNQSADSLFQKIVHPTEQNTINPSLRNLIESSPCFDDAKKNLIALDYSFSDNEKIYFKTIYSTATHKTKPTKFIVLMALDQSSQDKSLSSELITKYELTEKEQMVLRGLIHGKSIKEIACDSFISENTVKTHLKAIFRKTDTNSQTAVVGLILTHESQIIDSYFETGLNAQSFVGKTVYDKALTLASGDTIAYCDYGPEDGDPIVIFHSGYSCRISVPPNIDEICQRTKRRIIIPDRPGIGNTPFIKGHPKNWNAQLKEFINLLGIKSSIY